MGETETNNEQLALAFRNFEGMPRPSEKDPHVLHGTEFNLAVFKGSHWIAGWNYLDSDGVSHWFGASVGRSRHLATAIEQSVNAMNEYAIKVTHGCFE